MNPGRELDALIAEKVFGNKFSPAPLTDGWEEYPGARRSLDWSSYLKTVPYYSENIAAAFEAAEKIDLFKGANLFLGKTYSGKWAICEDFGYGGFGPILEGETTAHVICLASLKSLQNHTQ